MVNCLLLGIIFLGATFRLDTPRHLQLQCNSWWSLWQPLSYPRLGNALEDQKVLAPCSGGKHVEAVVTHALRTKRSQLDVSSQSGRWDYSQLSVVAESLSFHMARLAQRYGMQGVWFRFLGMNRLYLPLKGATGDEHNVFRESQALSQSRGSDLVSELIRWGMHVRCSPYIRFVATLALRLASIPIYLVLFWPRLRHAIFFLMVGEKECLPRSVCSSYLRASHIAQAADAPITRAGKLVAQCIVGSQ